MVYNSYIVDGIVYDVLTSSGTVSASADVYLFDVTTGGYMHTTTNASGEYSLDLSDDSITTWLEWTVGDKLQLYVKDSTGLKSICYRHTTAAGDLGNWNQDAYLHTTTNVSFNMSGTDVISADKVRIKNIIASNTQASSKLIVFYDKTNDIKRLQVVVPADSTISLEFKKLNFSGGVCPILEDNGNDGSGNNNVELQITYGD